MQEPSFNRESRIINQESRSGGIVLAGGKSTRMGTSKALLPFGPETMLQRVVRVLGGVVSPIVVVAAAAHALPALPSDVDAASVTCCDVPLLVPGFVGEMFRLADGHDIAVMEIEGFPHPLSAVYRRAVLPYVEALLAADRLRPVF